MKCVLLCLAVLAVASSSSAETRANQAWAKSRIEKSPRHREWITVQHGNRELKAFLGFPEVQHKATVVVPIQANCGLTAWVRSVVDQRAEAGSIAVAPDLLAGSGPNGCGTAEVANTNEANTKARAESWTRLEALLAKI